jgi:hypothetical protein
MKFNSKRRLRYRSDIGWSERFCGGNAREVGHKGRLKTDVFSRRSLSWFYCPIGVPSFGTRSCGVAVGGCIPSLWNTTIVSLE